LARQYFHNGQRWGVSTWQNELPVRASSVSRPPAPGYYDVLGMDAYLMSFDLAWSLAAEAADAEALAEFENAALTVKVKFLYIEQNLNVELRKWDRVRRAACASTN
jgi:hypothetical protein